LGPEYELNEKLNQDFNSPEEVLLKKMLLLLFNCKEAEKTRESTSDDNAPINVRKIKGTYNNYIVMLQNKFKKNGVCFDASLVAIIDSFDAANHLITDMGTTSIICFSSQLVSARTVSKGFTSTESLNIFTWKQVQKKESGKVVFFSVQDHYKKKSSSWP